MIITNGKKIGTAKVISNDLVPKGASVCGRKLASINYITLHNTGLVDVKANNFHRSLKRENALTNGRQASWTFTVDDVEIYQEVPTSWETWHSGTSNGNKNSISIEMCMWSDKEKQRKTYDNSARLVAELMKMHKISIDKVVQHYNWSKKNCPEYLRASKHGYNWAWFIELVKKYYNGNIVNDTTSTNTEYIVKVTADVLNVRSGAGTGYATVGQVKKGELYTIVKQQGNWGYLKSGLGWICLDYTEKVWSDYTVKITATSLNVRSGAGTSYTITGQVKKGEVYTIVEEKNNWGYLKSGLGWICLDYTEKNN